MNANLTRPTEVSAEDFLAAVEHPVRRADGLVLAEMMGRVTGEPAVMWGPTMVGFGSYRYATDSGRRGECFVVGFSPRKASLSLYGTTYAPESDVLLEQLGKHKRGAGCLYVNKLADVDIAILEQLVAYNYPYILGNLAS
ncbi:hypothetical protein CH272_14700 [Rhodococcus sp. 05-340-1]|uniref:DUF1801 domain-containing protein n=1 Tax=unclassified Rhodococcus (in: high G+C Gram-positive bacteria) TaxID=192944 RepID=UPI000B9B2895|nr:MULTISPECIES: DUF1801 domain-containing protein [unclassified Rhodococcus (in: high G+C Gram-positive bacteria)]OZD72494.1 hypothetical protein CH271_03255 [Rhodococcus sp. 05-340-2]OZD76175.1 hypothetical protein CH272_14700 [Rhodococcus sp. 05-340-1]OZF32683.1 hypothetical protein CH295_14100 [Rhodococcus sp. 14-2483-1-2]